MPFIPSLPSILAMLALPVLPASAAAGATAPDRGGCVLLDRLGSGTCTAKVSCDAAAPLEDELRALVEICAGEAPGTPPGRAAIDALIDAAGGETALGCCLAIPLLRP